MDAPAAKVVTFILPPSTEWSDEPPPLTFEDFIPEDPVGRKLRSFSAVKDKMFLATYEQEVRKSLTCQLLADLRLIDHASLSALGHCLPRIVYWDLPCDSRTRLPWSDLFVG